MHEENNTLKLNISMNSMNSMNVEVSFFGEIEFTNKIEAPIYLGNNIEVASIRDLAGTKMATIGNRVKISDYIDIYHILKHGISIKDCIECAEILYGDSFNCFISLQSMVYFKGLDNLSDTIKKYLEEKVEQYYDHHI